MHKNRIKDRSKDRVWFSRLYFSLVFGSLISLAMQSGCGRTDRALIISADTEQTWNAESVQQAAESAQQSAQTAGSAQRVAQTAVNGQEDAQTDPTAAEALLCVYVCGAVRAPGVVKLPPGSRVCDALEAAGGFDEQAETRAVNLAALVTDGQQIYFPTVEDTWSAESNGTDADRRVNINTADEALLCTLPGIGEARAQAIIAYRNEQGAFRKVEDIMQVSGIKEAAFEKIRELITVQ
ncbi:MAG: ComEA family DNA-binding protein [Lachnospiraceae bacterium]|nr:ComEA family DNA-binding protein [Lachnospiraceae bacterium]